MPLDEKNEVSNEQLKDLLNVAIPLVPIADTALMVRVPHLVSIVAELLEFRLNQVDALAESNRLLDEMMGDNK